MSDATPPNAAANLWVVIVAAGVGTRLGAAERKAGVPLGGVPLVVRSLRAFSTSTVILGGALVVHADDVDRARDVWLPAVDASFPWTVTPGGATRNDSTAAGLALAPPEANRFAVHDAARPLLHADDRDRVFASLSSGPDPRGVILAGAVTDTIQRVDDGMIVETLPREHLVAAQTPQCFNRAAFDAACAHGAAAGTDEAGWLVAAGIPVAAVTADHPNPKVTRPEDLRGVEALLGEENHP